MYTFWFKNDRVRVLLDRIFYWKSPLLKHHLKSVFNYF